MSNYTQSTDFSAKDALASGDPAKLVLGADIDTELSAISTAISSKLDTPSTETAKAAIKIVKGVRQPKYGIGIRSAWGPHVGNSIATPAKYIGF